VPKARCLGGDRGLPFDSQVLPLLRSKAVRLVKIDPKLTSSALKDKLSQALVVATVQAAKVMGSTAPPSESSRRRRCNG